MLSYFNRFVFAVWLVSKSLKKCDAWLWRFGYCHSWAGNIRKSAIDAQNFTIAGKNGEILVIEDNIYIWVQAQKYWEQFVWGAVALSEQMPWW